MLLYPSAQLKFDCKLEGAKVRGCPPDRVSDSPLGSKMEEMSAKDILWDVHVVLALAKATSGAL